MNIPHSREFDLTFALFREGYDLIANRCEALRSDIFVSRLMLQRIVCMRGAAAAELFYGSDKFTRSRAMPMSVLMLLQDFGSVQLLDGAAHRHRKAMFRSIGSIPAAKELARSLETEWTAALPRLESTNAIVLFDEFEALLTRCGATWAGVPLSDVDKQLRTREYSEMLKSSGSIGPRMLRALWLRRATERWARNVIRATRSGELRPPRDSALHKIAFHRDLHDRQLDTSTAAVELINIFRPIVAVAYFIVFAAKALHDHPAWRERLRGDDESSLENFVQEVRRTAPFFPFIGGRVCEPVVWNGYRFEQGAWVALDLYGTNMDARTWCDPHRFDPDRFARRSPSLFEFVPQGGGDPDMTHRCPGESMTVELMKMAVRLLLHTIDYEVPSQNLAVFRATIPTLPASGFIISNVKRRQRSHAPIA